MAEDHLDMRYRYDERREQFEQCEQYEFPVQETADKLLLPAYPEEDIYSDEHRRYTRHTVMSSAVAQSAVQAETIHSATSPAAYASQAPHTLRPLYTPPLAQPLARILYFWNADPVYKFLMIAISIALITSITFFTLLINTFASASLLQLQSTSQAKNTLSSQLTPGSVRSLWPTLAPTISDTDSQDSQPTAAATPVPASNSSASSSRFADGSTLQIIYLPTRVMNDSTITVLVSCLPGMQVHLMVTYDTAPYFFLSPEQTADSTGTARLLWPIHISSSSLSAFGTSPVAHVMIMAHDFQGHQAQSQTIAVTIH